MRHYIIFGSDAKYFQIGYAEAACLPNVLFQEHYLYRPTKIRSWLHLKHVFSRVNKIVPIPFKSIWFSQYYEKKYIPGDEYIFVFFFSWEKICNKGYLEYLHKHYPDCKTVLFLQDVNNARTLDIEYEKKRFNHIMVFEKNFARENDIEYYPLVYSEGLRELSYDTRPIDLLFVGGAKGRYKLLKDIYSKLTDEGIKCEFYLSRIDEPVDHCFTGIHIVDNVDYLDNVKLLKQSKCVLDIVPPNTNCNTLRVSEAICYKNRILTNNIHISEEEYYNPELISVYTDPHDMDIAFLKQPYQNVDYHYKDKISGAAFIKHLDALFYPEPSSSN